MSTSVSSCFESALRLDLRLDDGNDDDDDQNAHTDADDDPHSHVLPPVKRGVKEINEEINGTGHTTSACGHGWLPFGILARRRRGCL